MNRSESIAKLAAALAKAQQYIGRASKTEQNPFFKHNYASLGDVMAACKQQLLDCGISVLQLVGHDDKGNYLETILLHESGEFISDQMQIVAGKKDDPQSMGSAISYARRYALQSALFIPAVDDDAESAMAGNRELDKVNEQAVMRQQTREQAAVSAPRPQAASPQPTENRTPPGPIQDWAEVVCTYGKSKGPLRGKTLGELDEGALNFLYKTIIESGKPVDPKDKPMAEALAVWRLVKGTFIKPTSQVEDKSDEIPF